MSSIYNINKCIYLNFDLTTGTAYADVNVGFDVKEIVVRQSAFVDDSNNSGVLSFATLSSDLVQNQVLGILPTASAAAVPHLMTTTGTVRFAFVQPIRVAGTYTFQLRDFTGAAFVSAGTINRVCLLLEFIQDRSKITNVD
jgi:hypothetical protein